MWQIIEKLCLVETIYPSIQMKRGDKWLHATHLTVTLPIVCYYLPHLCLVTEVNI